jgi:hypothetical protein
MPIDPAALARNISQLAGLDAERDLGRAMQQITSAAKELLRVDGAGLMLADKRGQLRWATASDQQTQVIEEGEERLGQGPCVNAFVEHAPMAMRDAAKEPHWGKITDVGDRAGDAGRAECAGAAGGRPDRDPGPVFGCAQGLGSGRDQRRPGVRGPGRDAAQPAVGAQVKGRLAEQLQTAFAHRTRIERAKGMVMVQEGIDDAAAFERLRTAARSSRRPLIEVVDEVLGGQQLSRPRR